MKQTLKRAELVEMVAGCIPYSSINDLPMIRQALNDTVDAYERDGYRVREFDQDRAVEAVRRAVAAVAMR